MIWKEPPENNAEYNFRAMIVLVVFDALIIIGVTVGKLMGWDR